MSTEFSWFTGVADIAAPCPAALKSRYGLRLFFSDPNAPQWGTTLPRLLYHECLHFWQLASSRYLQLMVMAEWQRVLVFERDGVPPPSSRYRTEFGQAAPGDPLSVRDLLECLARFWDVHTRGPTRLLREEENDLDGQLASIEAVRQEQGHGGYSHLEFEAVLGSGRDCAVYAKPYHWMKERAAIASVTRELGEAGTSWAVNLLLPMAGYVALNTDAPVPAFVAAFERALTHGGIGIAASRRHPWRSINLDWLLFWPVLTPGMARALDRLGLGPEFAPTGAPLLADHPVYRHLSSRLQALPRTVSKLNMLQILLARVDAHTGAFDREALQHEIILTKFSPWAIFSLPGEPNFRTILGSVLAPPLVRFDDAAIPANASADPELPWPVSGPALLASIAEAESRLGGLRRAEAASRFGMAPNAFV